MAQPSAPLTPPIGMNIEYSRETLDRFVESQSSECDNVLGLVRPKDEGEIARLVVWANEQRIALVPIGSPGGPRRRGGTVPFVPALVVDTSGMNRMIHADGQDAIAIIEPGLTFQDFDRQLRPYGLRSFKPLLPRSTKSVLATYLEREPTIAPRDHWDSSDPLSALSITFGNGETFRSGNAGIPGTLEDNLKGGNRQMMSPGPIVSDYTRVILGSQGTLGIVGWGSIYCEPIPAREEAFLFGADDYEAVAELARLLALRQLGAHCFVLDRVQATAVLGKRAVARLAGKGLPEWVLYTSLSAADELADAAIDWQRIDLAELATSAGTRRLGVAEGIVLAELAHRLQNPPEIFYKDAPLGAHREAFCLTQLDKVPALIAAVGPFLAEAACEGIDVGIYVQPIIQGSSCHLEFTLFHEPGLSGAATRIEHGLIATLAEAGGFLSRPYGEWAKVAYGRDAGIVPYLKTLKDMFDPGGVLNPGKLCF